METYNCCYNCNNAILGNDSSRDCPPTFYGCMLDKDESIHKKGFAYGLNCFVTGIQTKEFKEQKEDKMYQIIEGRLRQNELTTLARLKAKYEPCANKLFGYRIFCGMISGVLVDTSWENVRDRVREYYKNDEKYLKYWNKQKDMFEDDGKPIIEVYDLSERFNDDISCIFELTM